MSYLQLIYASSASILFDNHQLRELLKKAQTRNETKDITGMLVFHEGCFLQVLEGEEGAVQELFKEIEKDPRHTRIRLILNHTIEKKEFDKWFMGFVDTSEDPESLEGFLDYAKDLKVMTLEKTQAKKVLRMFQEGAWRQHIMPSSP